MAQAPLSDEILLESIRFFQQGGSRAAAARLANIPTQTMQHRLAVAEKKFPSHFNAEDFAQRNLSNNNYHRKKWSYPAVYAPDGEIRSVLIGGDLHAWPGEPSLIWKAFCKIAKKIKPDAIVLNGDILDGASVSRHQKTLHSTAPKITEEIDAVKAHLRMLPKVRHQIWTMGNHDIRLDNYLANLAPEVSEYAGSFTTHFKDWKFCHSTFFNQTEIRHRFRGGIHSGWNNALHSGINIITNHTHQLQITAVRNRNGTHYGVETGMLADPDHPAFEYQEFAPTRACCGFVVIKYDEDLGIMPPEFCEMVRGRPVFRGDFVF